MSISRFVCVIGIVAALTAMLAVPVLAQQEQARLDLDFQGETLGQILQLLSRGYGLQYTLGEGVDPETRITTSLRDVTLDQALRSILEPNGLIAIEQEGRYVIRLRPEPQARVTSTQEIVPQIAGTTRTPPPSPTRTRPSYVPGASTTTGTTAGTLQDTGEDRILEIIWPKYLGADMAASIFGGSVIQAGGSYGSSGGGGFGGGSFGGGSSGGFGGSSGGFGGGFGSNRGSGGFGGNTGLGGGSSFGNTGSRRSNSGY